jgi:hypothetical protein
MSGTHGTNGRSDTTNTPRGFDAAGSGACPGRSTVWLRDPLFGLVVCALVAATATGCKTGSSMTKPSSWWSFKGDSATDSAKLAAAPRFEGDTRKPSETAKPYPTTSTPNGYVITGTGGPSVAAASIQPPSPQQPVVYGQTPPPAAAAPTITAAAPATAGYAPPAGGAGGVGQPAAQVGPYASLGGDQIPPAGQPLPNIAPLSSPSAPAAPAAYGGAAGYAGPAAGQPGEAALPTAAFAGSAQPPVEPPAARMADARGAVDPRGAEAAFAAGAAEAAGSRYSNASSSRFGGSQPAASYPTAAAAGGFGRPPEAPVAPATQSPPGLPAAPAATPSLLPPSGQPAGMPTSPPTRRPDPGYRPFGTSSYRPSQAILADETPGPSPVRTVAFEEAAPPVR